MISPLFLDGVWTIGLWGLFEVRPVVLCSSHTPQGSLWVIWAIGCGGFMPLEPPSVLLQGFGPFCLGTLFARFGLWIATNMATAGPKHPQEFPWASGGAGWQWGAAKPMSGPSRAHETAISPGGQMAAGVFSFFYIALRRSAMAGIWPFWLRRIIDSSIGPPGGPQTSPQPYCRIAVGLITRAPG